MKPFDYKYKFVGGLEKVISIEIQRLDRIQLSVLQMRKKLMNFEIMA
jgi:hypothetical protein